MLRLGVVSFLNSRPLIAGLDGDPDVRLILDVPAALPAWLDAGTVDAALVPWIDVLRSGGRYQVVSDACIASDGETMTVRVFSRVPPDRVTTLYVDADSHTSVALATVLWGELFGRRLTVQRCDARSDRLDAHEAVLLIGDKVVTPGRGSFGYEVDLGGAWRAHTGLPFVFAVWAMAAPVVAVDLAARLSEQLSMARDRGVARAAEIARECGPALGWPVELAHRYLTRCLCYHLDERARAGAERFAQLCRQYDLAPDSSS